VGEHVIKLPDVGEGVAEAELVEWHVTIGDPVREDQMLAAVMTDKATVEVPSPVDGDVVWLGAEIGDTVAVGSPLVRLTVAGEGNVSDGVRAAAEIKADSASEKNENSAPIPDPAAQGGGERAVSPAVHGAVAESARTTPTQESPSSSRGGIRGGGQSSSEKTRSLAETLPRSAAAPRPEGEKPLASPAVRLRAKEAGIDLRRIAGSGPAGRITHEDIDASFVNDRRAAASPSGGIALNEAVEDIKLVGLRRKIAEKMRIAKARIPHITYVEEIDVTALEELRGALNRERTAKGAERSKLTLLPFLMRAMVKAIAEQPQVNALFDDEAGIIRQYGGVHIGIAAQTPNGLVVPVVKHAEARDLWNCAAEINRLAEAAKAGTATREELSGSTITITSLGAMGGIATTPVINHPEVAIVGVNKIMMRPMWDGAQFVPRKMMNLSSSFDHRVIDGWDAAVFIQRVKALLETPALIFVEG
jgi:2-oxoisovalerate dehydrogenase E2 component (dihydrolipoyl transacylase)